MWSFERSSRAAFAGVMGPRPIGRGFHLRKPGRSCLFETLYISGAESAGGRAEAQRRGGEARRAWWTARERRRRFSAHPGAARRKIILSFSAAGRVSEYQFRYRVGFRVPTRKGAQVYCRRARFC